MKQCKWSQAWLGRCKGEAGIMGYCGEHDSKKCSSCGDPATHDCGQTGQFVCGAPLCDRCEHAIFPDGTNGGIGFDAARLPVDGLTKRHVRKDAQKHTPWYTRERDTKDLTV